MVSYTVAFNKSLIIAEYSFWNSVTCAYASHLSKGPQSCFVWGSGSVLHISIFASHYQNDKRDCCCLRGMPLCVNTLDPPTEWREAPQIYHSQTLMVSQLLCHFGEKIFLPTHSTDVQRLTVLIPKKSISTVVSSVFLIYEYDFFHSEKFPCLFETINYLYNFFNLNQ